MPPSFLSKKSKIFSKDGKDFPQQKSSNESRSISFDTTNSPNNLSETNLDCSDSQTEDNSKNYSQLKQLSQGKYSKIVLSKSINNDKFYSIKIFDKNKLEEDHKLSLIRNEKKILMDISNCSFTINLKEAFDSGNTVWLVSEYPCDKNLSYLIKKNKKLTHRLTMFYAAEIYCGLKYLHVRNILYRNLTLENVIITLNGHIKLSDFGFAKELTKNEPKAITFCGNPAYMAPEMILTKPYTYSVDWWAYGVIMYVMITGTLPFSKKTDGETLKSVLTDLPVITSKLGPLTEEFLSHLLDKDPYFRLGCYCSNGYDEIETHKFFSSIDWNQVENQAIEVHYLPYENSPSEFEFGLKEQKVGHRRGSVLEV